MEAHTKKIISAAALGLALLAHTVPTWAGAKQSYEVTIISTNGESTAYGTVNAARYSSDTKQSIGCLISSTPGYSIVYCSAWDKTGAGLVCSTNDPSMIQAVRSMNNDTLIQFWTPSYGAACTAIYITSDSQYLK